MVDLRIIWALEEEEMFSNGAALILQLRQQQRRHAIVRKRRTVWTRGWLLNRPVYGQYENMLAELNQEDFRGYKKFLRISNELFEKLVHHVGPHIKKITTPWRQPLSVGLRLAITLRYMASGDSFMSLQYSFWVANNTI